MHRAHAYILQDAYLLQTTSLESQNILLCFTHFHMSGDQQQSLKEYSDVVTLPITAPPVPHNQAAMPREYAVCSAHGGLSFVSSTHGLWLFQTHPAPEISQDGIFAPPPAAHPAFFDPYRASYVPHYGPIPPVSIFTGEKSAHSRS